MSPTPTPSAPTLAQASHALRQVLLRLDQYAKNQVQRADPATRYGAAALTHVKDLEALLTAVEQYEQAALASLAPAPVNIGHLSPAQLRAYREADPVYRLGYVRGHQAGAAQAQRTTVPVLTAYAQHATLPAPTAAPSEAYAKLVANVRRFLAQLTARRAAGSAYHQSSQQLYGTH